MNDAFIFAPEEDIQQEENSPALKKWKIAIIDDDHDVHQITKLALSGFEFEGGQLEFVEGYSGAEAKKIFDEQDDIAIVLLDVVMEDDHAGLDVARYIRETCHNMKTRIILRTGQPGQAPEEKVIRTYDINDYKEKTELTSRKLFTLLYSSLRSYRDIISLDKAKLGLEKVIHASQNIFEEQFIEEFAAGILQQITSIMRVDDSALIGEKTIGAAARESDEGLTVVAGTGEYAHQVGNNLSHILSDTLFNHIMNHSEGCYYIGSDFLAFSKGKNGQQKAIFLKNVDIDDNLNLHLLELFAQNVLIAFDNLALKEEVMETQREVVYRLGEAVETRSKETGNHVKRVAEMSKLLAMELGMSKADAEILKHASPLHDLGKIGIPDAILNKPGKLDPHEWEVMQSHVMIGYNMLNDSKREILRVGAIISKEHHEKWDGSGYPAGLKGEEIDLVARITAVADVYDALASDRCYKKAWPLEKVYTLFKEESGQHFDPKVVEKLFENIDAINAIRDKYIDICEDDSSKG